MIDYSHFQKNKALHEFSTIGIGGPARFFIEVNSIAYMQEVIHFCFREALPFFVLGKGSNSLFDDRGFDGLVILNKIDFVEQSEGLFYVGAGYSFSLLGTQTAKLGWEGLEFASGIPGSVGGAVFMNAGAAGFETSTFLKEVTFVNSRGELLNLKKAEIDFSYRYSSFQKMEGAIVAAKFFLKASSEARSRQLQYIKHRLNTQPYTEPSVGCIFKNPTHQSAGAILDSLGLKGFSIGGAKISDKHANFLINQGCATQEDMLSLMQFIKKKVKEEIDVTLEEEVRIISYKASEK